jgi:hypothetical protein
MKLFLKILDDTLTVHRFPGASPVPSEALRSRFYSISRTADELSVVCDSTISLNSDRCEPGWGVIQVAGPLDFSLTGILAAITMPLAEAGITVFAVSTFDTDYILVKKEALKRAQEVLEKAGCLFARGV